MPISDAAKEVLYYTTGPVGFADGLVTAALRNKSIWWVIKSGKFEAEGITHRRRTRIQTKLLGGQIKSKGANLPRLPIQKPVCKRTIQTDICC